MSTFAHSDTQKAIARSVRTLRNSNAPQAKKRGGLEPNAAEVAECARLGFTEEATMYSEMCNEYGPRGTLSNEGRLLRWCSFFDHDEPVRELTREERRAAWNYEQLFSLPERASREFATVLNAQGMVWNNS